MSNVENRPLDSRGSSLTIGMLALVAAALSFVIYVLYGRWPAELGGLELAFFLLLGIGLIGYGWTRN